MSEPEKTTMWRKRHNAAQLNVHLDADTKKQFARICKLRDMRQREVIERLVIGWITGTIQLP